MSYLSLDEAAAKLGIPADRLVELRSQGQIRGFRDGSSWKFPESEIDRLADDMAADDGFGSGILVDDAEVGGGGSIGSIIGAEGGDEGEGSDLNIGGEIAAEGGSDVNLVTEPSGTGSDVALVASDSGPIATDDDSVFDTDEGDLMEIDSAELKLDDPAILRDSNDSIDIAIDPKEGSTGPVAKAEIQKEADNLSLSDVDVPAAGSGEDFQLDSSLSEEDSDELVLGEDSDSLDLDSISDDLKSKAGQSSLELMGELGDGSTDKPMKTSSAGDVLSELDLIGSEKTPEGSGLITGDSENLLTSSGLGSGLGSSVVKELDDALDEDDDLVIADDDDELMLDSVSDISVAGDSGINLMSPSDSGLSLESEPLDLAGSSLSALDLGAELTDGSGISSGKGSGSAVGGDEEFQLSPSGVGLDDPDSSSQVIEVEDSEIVGDVVDLQDEFADDAGFADAGFAAEPMAADAFEEAPADAAVVDAMDGGEAMVLDDEAPESPVAAGAVGYEVPFTLMQCLTLLCIVLMLSLCGMLMSDLVRNMWAYSETAAPVSSLTDSLISLMGLD